MGKFIFKPDDSAYILIDMQEKLASAMPQEAYQQAQTASAKMLQACHALNMPVLSLRQYPKGLGDIIATLKPYIQDDPIDKLTFSAFKEATFKEKLAQIRAKNIFLSGMETHICVLQTAIDLIEAGYNVQILADCCISRDKQKYQQGLAYMQQAGCLISNIETAMFQLIQSSQHECFKIISNLVK